MFIFWPEDIQQHPDRIDYFNAEMGGKNTKNQVNESETGSSKCAVIRSTRNDRSDYSGTTEPYRYNCTKQYRHFLIFFLQDKKKRVGTKIVNRVRLPKPVRIITGMDRNAPEWTETHQNGPERTGMDIKIHLFYATKFIILP